MAENKQENNSKITEEEFFSLHKAQLEATEIPNHLWQVSLIGRVCYLISFVISRTTSHTTPHHTTPHHTTPHHHTTHHTIPRQQVYVKIRDQVLDAGSSFQLNWEEEKGFF